MQEGAGQLTFMQEMTQPERAKRLYEIVNAMVAPFGKTVPEGLGGLLRAAEPFDTSKPNQHDSKSEFLREYKAVQSCVEYIDKTVDNFAAGSKRPKQAKMLERLAPIINHKMASNPPDGELGNSHTLVRRNVGSIGGFYASLLIMIDFSSALESRLSELEDQRQQFWNLPHRAPDYYARAIALRLAKLYAQITNQYPTIGTSGETGEASTAYSRALEQVFEVLGIESRTRLHAEWAVGQLTDDDLGPPEGTLAHMLGLDPSRPPNALLQFALESERKKGDDQ